MLTPDQLRKYSLFSNLQDRQLDELSIHFSKRLIAGGAYLFYPGSPAIKTYLVEEGLVRLFFINSTGQEFLVNLVRPGEVIGLPLMEDEQLRLIGAAAYEPSVVISIACEDLIRIAAHSTTLMSNMYQEVNINARKLLLHSRSLIIQGLTGRVATMLLRLSRRNGNQDVIEMPLTQTEFAGWLGASRGRINRVMNQLQNLGLISHEDQRIIILDRSGLKLLAEEENKE